MEKNIIYNEDCFKTMDMLIANDERVDCILTSPPYNMTKRKGGYADTGRYDVYEDWKTEEEYINWTVNLFNKFDQVLNEDRVVLYNFSYSIENPALPYKLVSNIVEKTKFTLIDTIIWKKKNGLPFPANSKRLCRIWEYVFVFVRKEDIDTYTNNRRVSSISEKTGQKYYEAIYNYVDAANNDGKCPFNQATYSSELCLKLMDIYCLDNYVVYDPFMGSGTTGVACRMRSDKMSYIGSEISDKQCKFAKERIEKYGKDT